MTHYSGIRKTGRSGAGVGAVFSALALASICLCPSVWADDMKSVGATLLSLQYPFLVSIDKAMKTEAAKQRIGLISLDPQQGVATELSQIEDLITKKVDLIVMIPVDQKTSQPAAKLINQAGISLVLLNTKFTDDFASTGGKFATFVGSDDIDAGKIEGR